MPDAAAAICLNSLWAVGQLPGHRRILVGQIHRLVENPHDRDPCLCLAVDCALDLSLQGWPKCFGEVYLDPRDGSRSSRLPRI